MSRVISNSRTLQGSLKGFEKAMNKHVLALLEEAAKWLLRDCYSLRAGWLGFTGNLPTSYAAGIYKNGQLQKILFIGKVVPSLSRPVIRRKLYFEEVAYLREPYEGEARKREGKVEIDYPFGTQASAIFLKTQHPGGAFSIVLCTGAEYSEWLEDAGKDVLTGAFHNAANTWTAAVERTSRFDDYFGITGADEYDALDGLAPIETVPF